MLPFHKSSKKRKRIEWHCNIFLSLCEYNPDLMMLAVDYVDNIKENEEVGNPNLKDLAIYNASIRNILNWYKIKVVDDSWNHDQWAVDIYNSKENNFCYYCFNYNGTSIKNDSDFFWEKYN